MQLDLNVLDRQVHIRLDYQPLFGKMSPHSSPERAAGRVRFLLLVWRSDFDSLETLDEILE